MLSIHLHHLQFFAHHGIYEEEKILGNRFEVNVELKHSSARLPVYRLEDTIDYVAVYELIRKRMAVPTPLLETLAMEIAQEILAKFSLAEEVFLSIRKLHPPVSGMEGSVGVCFTLKRSGDQ